MHVIAVYARASKDRTERRISVDRQVAQTTAMMQGLFPELPIRVYVDNDLSAADPEVFRPDYQRLIGDIRRGEVAEVAAHAQARLTRQTSEWDDLVVTLTKAKITKVHTVLGGLVAVAPGNRAVGKILAAIDAEEAERTKARFLSMHEQLAAEGRPNGGRTYGYRHAKGDDGRAVLEVVATEAAVIRLICDRLLEGHSMVAVAALLNEKGEPTPRGPGRWRHTTVRRVVTKPTIAGLRGYHDQVTPTTRWEPIIAEERWRAVVRAVDGRSRPSSGRAGRRWLLTGGLAVCGACGEPLSVVNKGEVAGQTRYAYACHIKGGREDACGKVSLAPAEVIEDLVVAQVLQALDNPKMAKRLVADPDPKRARLLAEVADAEGLMNEAAELRGAGVYDKERWERQFYPAKARAEAGRAALAAMPDPNVVLPPADQVADRWENMPLRQQRALLERFIEVVTVLPATTRGRSKLSTAERVDSRLDITWRR
jgi:DNA invertase Pin-like site-specific DNA recombinase